MRLVADIGGTNARLALSENGVVDNATVQRFTNADWPSLDAVLAAFCDAHLGTPLDEMVIAVAGPVSGGRATLTNRNWSIDTGSLGEHSDCKFVVLLNDLTALGHAVPMIGADQIRQVCGGDAPKMRTGRALVVGIGTGFNISQVITTSHGTVCPPAEAGHVSMPRRISKQLDFLNCDSDQFPTVETLFSGRGLTAFCQRHTGQATLSGQAAIDAYGKLFGDQATNAINNYASMLGSLLRELSLFYAPTQGTYLAGSVARAIARTAPDKLENTLREQCEFKSPSPPLVYTINDDGAALLGCARYSRCS